IEGAVCISRAGKGRKAGQDDLAAVLGLFLDSLAIKFESLPAEWPAEAARSLEKNRAFGFFEGGGRRQFAAGFDLLADDLRVIWSGLSLGALQNAPDSGRAGGGARLCGLLQS